MQITDYLGISTVGALLLCAGCASDGRLAEGKRLLAEGRTEAGLALVEQAMRANPRQRDIRTYWVRERDLAIARLVAEAEVERTRGRLVEAEALYGRVMKLDPNDSRAKAGSEAIATARRHEQQLRDAESRFARNELDSAEAIVRAVLAENAAHPQAREMLRRVQDALSSRGVAPPRLAAASVKPVNLEFRDAPLRNIFEVIAKTSGINFVFDKDVRPDLRSTINVRNSTVDDVIRLILVTNQLERKVLNENTILVYPNTPAKLREYQELAVRSFYLANADVKQTLAMIKTMVKTRDVFIDEKLGLLVMKDTPDAIRLAEKLIAAQDLAEPEVTLEVEVLEVGSSRMQELGARFPDQVVLQDPATVTVAGAAPTGAFMRASGSLVAFVATPAVILNLRQQDGTTNVLANPRIRVKNREKARVHIGDRVPVITTTATANVGVSASVNYLDVGLKLDVEPAIQLEGDVVMKVGLEVSNIVREVPTSGGGLAYQLGTRNATTVLRLRDGETQVLAGLIQDGERRTTNRVPGLGNLPVLGRLFSNENDARSRTEIVLLITPRVVRALLRPDHVASQYHSGTDGSIGTAPLSIRSGSKQMSLSSTAGALPAQAQSPSGESAVRRTQPPAGPQPLGINLSAPPQVAPGQTFNIIVELPPEAKGAVTRMELLYDPAVLVPASAPASARPGQIPLTLSRERPAQSIAMQVIARVIGNTEVRVDNVTVRDTAGAPVPTAPPPLGISIAP